MIVHWHDETFECNIAVRGYNYIVMYDENYNEIQQIVNIIGREWNDISIENGEWSDPSIIPTELERVQADVDFLTMENESLTEQTEIDRADIDYLLMLVEEEE